MKQKSYWVYILLCNNNTYYTGYTNNLEKRFQAHLNGKASKYTRSFKPIRIVQYWQVQDKSAAMSLECRIKNLSRVEKEKIIAVPSLLLLENDTTLISK